MSFEIGMPARALAALVAMTLACAASGCAHERRSEPGARAPADAVCSVAAPDGAAGCDAANMSLGEATAALDAAELRLAALLGLDQANGRDAEKTEAAPPDTQSPAPAPAAGAAPAGETASRRAPGPAERCAIACRALGSMQRSAERLCALSGDDDGTCGDARARTDRARVRVARACPACAAARPSPPGDQ